MLNDSIRVFLTVVEKKSFSKAAKALFLTQPAVSFQIQMLEEYYGTRLFDRVSRNIILTDAGHLLLKYANETQNLRNITIISNPGTEKEKSQSFQAAKGLVVGLIYEEEEYVFEVHADAECTQPYDPYADTESDQTIYIKWIKEN